MGAALAGPDGGAGVILPPLPAGAYKATVTAKRADGTAVGEAEDAFVVAPASRELIEAAPRPDILQAVAEAAKGRVVDVSDALAALPWRDPERVEVGQRTSKPLWDNWKVLALLCLVVGTEGTLRRRWGYAGRAGCAKCAHRHGRLPHMRKTLIPAFAAALAALPAQAQHADPHGLAGWRLLLRAA